MKKDNERRMEDAEETLKRYLPKGATVFTILKAQRKGEYDYILLCSYDNSVRNITARVNTICGQKGIETFRSFNAHDIVADLADNLYQDPDALKWSPL